MEHHVRTAWDASGVRARRRWVWKRAHAMVASHSSIGCSKRPRKSFAM